MPHGNNPMVITLDHFNRMREHFKQHYFLSNWNSNFGGQDIQIPWSSFSLVVQNFINTYNVSPDTVALRFVHCYDSNSNELYLRLQICTMTPDPSKPDTYNLVTTNVAWYTIANGSIAPTGVIDLQDQNYLNNFYYCNAAICSPAHLVNLASDTGALKFVRNLVFPWTQELHKLHVDNGSPANASVCFAAASHNNTSPVLDHPHALAIYLRKHDGTPLMDNKEYALEFQMKAADMGTLCPSNCGVYIIPKN